MRNKTRFYGIIIAGLFFLSVGCETKQFKVEKALWKASRSAKKIFDNPNSAAPYELNKAVEAYRKIIKDYPGLAEVAQNAQMSIGAIYLAKKDFETARKEFSKLIQNCNEESQVCAVATFAVGRCFEIEGKWAKAEECYKKIIDSFPLTTQATRVPLYLIRSYTAKGNTLQAQQAVDEAVAYYQRLQQKVNNKQFSMFAQQRIIDAYLLGKDWKSAIANLTIALEKFADNDEARARILLAQALLYQRQLNDKPKATELFQQIQEKYPTTKTAKGLKAYLAKVK